MQNKCVNLLDFEVKETPKTTRISRLLYGIQKAIKSIMIDALFAKSWFEVGVFLGTPVRHEASTNFNYYSPLRIWTEVRWRSQAISPN